MREVALRATVARRGTVSAGHLGMDRHRCDGRQTSRSESETRHCFEEHDSGLLVSNRLVLGSTSAKTPFVREIHETGLHALAALTLHLCGDADQEPPRNLTPVEI